MEGGSRNYFTRVTPVHCQESIVMSRHSSGNFGSKAIFALLYFSLLTTQQDRRKFSDLFCPFQFYPYPICADRVTSRFAANLTE